VIYERYSKRYHVKVHQLTKFMPSHAKAIFTNVGQKELSGQSGDKFASLRMQRHLQRRKRPIWSENSNAVLMKVNGKEKIEYI